MANFALNCLNLVQDAVWRERIPQKVGGAELPGFKREFERAVPKNHDYLRFGGYLPRLFQCPNPIHPTGHQDIQENEIDLLARKGTNPLLDTKRCGRCTACFSKTPCMDS